MSSVSGSDEDMPLAARVQRRSVQPSTDDDIVNSDSDAPQVPRKRLARRRISDDDDDDEASEAGTANKSNRSSSSLSDNYKDDDSESDVPLSIKKAANGSSASNGNGHSNGNGNGVTAGRSRPAPKYKEESSDDDYSSDEVPLSKKANKKAPVKSTAKANSKAAPTKPTKGSKVKKEEEAPAKGQKRKAEPESASKKRSTKAEASSSRTTKKVKKEEDEDAPKPRRSKKEDDEEEVHEWWLDEANDGSVKWKTLQHNGVYFAPEYEPHGIRMKYDGQFIKLAPEVEEVASFFAAMLDSDHVNNPKFRKNFFDDFSKLAKKLKTVPEIKSFEKCDFNPIFEHLQKEREKKKAATKEDKDTAKEEKLRLENHYGTCLLDGRKEKVGNFRIEPPGLFRGRGDHPKTGRLKLRVQPEQVTLNLSKDAAVPQAPPGHSWAGVVHDDTKTWLATWKENVNDSTKYVFLAAGSSLKGQSDLKKFETARELKKCVKKIRATYEAELKDKQMAVRQRATAMYLIDRFALRAGNEKNNDEEADTVGCCSLRYEHVTLEKPNIMHLDFLGKDSIRFQKKMEIDDQVFKNIRLFKREPATDGDDLFDRLSTSSLNKHLTSLMPGLTAKVFRTYNASFTFQEQLKNTPVDGTVADKLLAYNRANRQVAELCNHQRAVSKGHDGQMEKIREKIRALKYQKFKLKRTILTLEPKLKKKEPELLEMESDLDEDWIAEHEVSLIEAEKEKTKQKHEKENIKRKENKEKKLTEADLKESLKALDAKLKELVKERKTGLVTNTKSLTVEKCKQNMLKVDERINNTKLTLTDKDENKQTALGTSKINYIDPRISTAWCQKYDVPLEKVFTKTLRDKFKWAMTVEDDWVF